MAADDTPIVGGAGGIVRDGGESFLRLIERRGSTASQVQASADVSAQSKPAEAQALVLAPTGRAT